MTTGEKTRGPLVEPHPEDQTEISDVTERQCECYHGPPTRKGLSGHEFSPFDSSGRWTRDRCEAPGLWRGLWQCGACPDTHTVLVCAECRLVHDADAATGLGAQLMWVTAHVGDL